MTVPCDCWYCNPPPPDAATASLRIALNRCTAALVQIIDQARDEPGGLNFAHRASTLAREALGWEKE